MIDSVTMYDQISHRDLQQFSNMFKHKHRLPDVIVEVYIPTTMRVFNVSFSALFYPVPGFAVSNNTVEVMDWSHNVLHNFNGPVYGFDVLKHLNLSTVYCTDIKTGFFSHFPKLQSLRLDNNFLGERFKGDSEGEIFSALNVLHQLDLSENRIVSLPPNFFRGLVSLKRLDVSHNFITEWQPRINHLVNLRMLDISGNILASLSETFMKDFDEILKTQGKPGNSIIIELSKNAFSCLCNSIDMLNWFSIHKQYIQHFTSINCSVKGGNRKKINFSEIHSLILEMEKECASYIPAIFGMASLIFLVLSFVVFCIIYRYRWKLRYLYYMARNGSHGYQQLPANSKPYRYDAFVSYAELNRSYVADEMVHELEAVSNFRLCLSGRHFRPGASIAANITNAINRSRKTIVVMTEDFLDSYWCMYELNMARMESIYARGGDDILCLIFYENIPLNTLPHQVLELVNKQSFIQYPSDAQGKVVFWEKIRETISS